MDQVFDKFLARENWYKSRDVAQEGIISCAEGKQADALSLILKFNAELAR